MNSGFSSTTSKICSKTGPGSSSTSITMSISASWSIIMTLSLLTVRAFDAGRLFKVSLISGGLSKSIFLKGNLAKLV